MSSKIRSQREQIIQSFNERHAVIFVGGKLAVLTEIINPATERPDIRYSSKHQMIDFYCNKLIKEKNADGKEVLVNPFKIWWEHPDRTEYARGIVFDPTDKEQKGVYNLWRGFAIEPKQGDCDLYLNHVYNIICSGSNFLYTWVMDWMAHMFQFPGAWGDEKIGTCLVFMGGQGTGKGTVVNPLAEIMGSHYMYVNNPGLITGRFNSHLKDSLLTYIDEGTWGGDKAAAGALKGLITEDYIPIEAKNYDAVLCKNLTRFIIASNNDWVVPAEIDERRFAVIAISEAKKQNQEYFKAIRQQMANGGTAALFYELLHREITSDLRTIPRTEALLGQIGRTLNSVGRFWLDCLRTGNVGDVRPWGDNMEKSRVYSCYQRFCDDTRERRPKENSIFFIKLREVCPLIGETRPYTAGYRPVFSTFPALSEARQAFEQKVGISIKWEEQSDQS